MFFYQRPPEKVEVSPHSGLYLLVLWLLIIQTLISFRTLFTMRSKTTRETVFFLQKTNKIKMSQFIEKFCHCNGKHLRYLLSPKYIDEIEEKNIKKTLYIFVYYFSIHKWNRSLFQWFVSVFLLLTSPALYSHCFRDCGAFFTFSNSDLVYPIQQWAASLKQLSVLGTHQWVI